MNGKNRFFQAPWETIPQNHARDCFRGSYLQYTGGKEMVLWNNVNG